MSSWTPTTYKTKNWSDYNRALKKRGSLSIWFDAEMTWEAKPSGKRGRQQIYSDASIQACLTLKVLFGLPLRQTTGFVESLLELVGLDWSVPDFSTLCRPLPGSAYLYAREGQKILPVVIPYRGSQGPLHLLVDSTGIKAEGEGEWNARKHGGPKRRLWRKIHIGIDEQTLEIRAIEVTSSSIGDSPILPGLLSRIAPGHEIGSVTAPSRQIALQSPAGQRTVHTTPANATMRLQIGTPMPLSRRARTPNSGSPPFVHINMHCRAVDTPGAKARNEAVRSSRYLGRALWRQLTGYHRRSRVETKMHCVKLLGQRLSARDFDRQVAEIQIRAAILNRYTALGIPETVTVG